MNHKAAEVLVVSWTIPPYTSGSSRVLHNLLTELDDDEFVLIGGSVPQGSPVLDAPTQHRRVFIPAVPPTTRGERFLRFLGVPLTVAAGLWTIRKTRPRVLLVVFPDETYLLAGYLLHRLSGLPLTLYFHDLYLENRQGFLFRRLAEWLQPKAFARAARLFVVSPGMGEHYQQAYTGLDPKLVPHSISMPIPDTVTVPAAHTPFRVGFCGNINAPDELRTLKALVGDQPDLRMQLFTPATPAQLESWGLTGKHVERDFKKTSADLQVGLAGCDALFLPLPFDSKVTDPRELETAFPTKAFDYLTSGRPILVHCPGHYYMARFFREHGAALVVDSPEPAALLAALRNLQTDEGLRQQLAQRGLEVARRYQASRIAAELRQDLRALWRPESA